MFVHVVAFFGALLAVAAMIVTGVWILVTAFTRPQ